MKISIIISKALNIEYQKIDMNLTSQSLINTAGMSQFFLSSFYIIVLTHSCILQVVLFDTSSIVLLNLHVMMTRQSNPAFLRNLTIKFIAKVWNGFNEVTIRLSLPYHWCFLIWSLWQSEQCFIYCQMHLII